MSRDSYPVDPPEDRNDDHRGANRPFDSQSEAEARSIEQADVAANDLRAADRLARNQRVPEALDSPRAHYARDRTYFLRDSELETLAEVGTFRVIAAPDLARTSYGGDEARMEREIRRLKQQSLLSEKRLPVGRNKTTRLLALTKRGARLVRKSGRVQDEQAIYHGFAKPREAKHDADLYRLYQAEVERIESAGGRPTRVIFDYELKRNLNRDLAALDQEGRSPEALERLPSGMVYRLWAARYPCRTCGSSTTHLSNGTTACRPGTCDPQLQTARLGRKSESRLFSVRPPRGYFAAAACSR